MITIVILNLEIDSGITVSKINRVPVVDLADDQRAVTKE